jgi:hypothetical protein
MCLHHTARGPHAHAIPPPGAVVGFVEALEDGATELTGPARIALMRGWEHWQALDGEITRFDAQVAGQVKDDEQAQRVMAIVGIGPLTASALIATVVDARQFRNGRQFAAWLGLVPKQASSGGKTRLGRITKQSNEYLRTLLWQGARSATTTFGNDNSGPATRPAVALDRPAAGKAWLVPNAGGRCQQACTHPLGNSGQGGTLQSVIRPQSPRRWGCDKMKAQIDAAVEPFRSQGRNRQG